MNLSRTLLVALSLSLGLAAAAPAQAAPTVKELKSEVREGKQALRDDKRDYRQINGLAAKWGKARGNDRKEARVDARIDDWLREEIAENRAASRDARASFVSNGGDLRVLRTDSNGRRPKIAVPARAASDLKAIERAKRDQQNTRQLAQELRGIQAGFAGGFAGDALYQYKDELLAELIRSQARDARHSKRALADAQARLDRRR